MSRCGITAKLWDNITPRAAATFMTSPATQDYEVRKMCSTGLLMHAGQIASCGCQHWPLNRLFLWPEQGGQRLPKALDTQLYFCNDEQSELLSCDLFEVVQMYGRWPAADLLYHQLLRAMPG